MRIAVLLSGVVLGGCFSNPQNVGEDKFIRGTVSGMWDGATVTLRLVAGDVDESLPVSANGSFAFAHGLNTDDTFDVTIDTQPEHHTCVISGNAGTVGNADVTGVAVDCTGPSVDVAFSMPVDFAFDATTLEQTLEVSVAQQQTSITVTAPDATDVRVNGGAATSGVASVPALLALGANMYTIELQVDALSRTYIVTVDRDGTALQQYVYAKASNAEASDLFSSSVAASGDTIVVGACCEDSGASGTGGDQSSNTKPNSGAVYVFRRSGTAWTQEAYLKSSDPRDGQGFGSALAISGNVLVVGAPGDLLQAGAAYVFRRSGSTWTQEAKLVAPQPDQFDAFGSSVTASPTGDRLSISAPYESSAATGINGNQSDNSSVSSGAVYVFVHGASWTLEAYVKASNTGDGDNFGISLAETDTTLVVGSPSEASNAVGINGSQSNDLAPASGAVYVFVRNGNVWTQQAYLKASNTDASDEFGFSVAMDAETLAVGAPYEDGGAVESGAVYMFTRSATLWSQQQYLKAANAEAMDYFGGVALKGDVLLVSAGGEDGSATGVDGPDDNGAQNSGAVYVFGRVGSSWAQDAYVKASNTDAGDAFGTVALSGDDIVVGAWHEDSSAAGLDGDQSNNGAIDSGAIYIFR